MEQSSLLNMSSDMVQKMALNMSYDEIMSLCLTHKKFNKILCQNSRFWRDKYKHDILGEQLYVIMYVPTCNKDSFDLQVIATYKNLSEARAALAKLAGVKNLQKYRDTKYRYRWDPEPVEEPEEESEEESEEELEEEPAERYVFPLADYKKMVDLKFGMSHPMCGGGPFIVIDKVDSIKDIGNLIYLYEPL